MNVIFYIQDVWKRKSRLDEQTNVVFPYFIMILETKYVNKNKNFVIKYAQFDSIFTDLS